MSNKIAAIRRFELVYGNFTLGQGVLWPDGYMVLRQILGESDYLGAKVTTGGIPKLEETLRQFNTIAAFVIPDAPERGEIRWLDEVN